MRKPLATCIGAALLALPLALLAGPACAQSIALTLGDGGPTVTGRII